MNAPALTEDEARQLRAAELFAPIWRALDAAIAVLEALLDASGSDVLRLCLNPVMRIVSAMPALRSVMYHNPTDNLAGWQLLLGQLEHGTLKDGAAIDHVLKTRDEATLAALAPLLETR